MLELGLLYQQGGSRAALERLCRDWMALQPASGMPYWLLGRQAIRQLRPKDAIHLFETACSKNPERSDFCMALGLAYAAASAPEKLVRARPWLEKAIALDPRAPGPHQQLGWMLEQARRLGTSEAELLRAYPTLRAEDLANAWAFVRSHGAEITQQIDENEAD